MKENLNYFYTYTKSLRKSSSKIRPFTDNNNKVIKIPEADTLQDEYSCVWSYPSEKYRVQNPKEFFRTQTEKEPIEIL